MEWRPSYARAVALALTALAAHGPAVPSQAAGVDGAGRIVVVPLVITGVRRESVVTVTNTGSEDLVVRSLYVGAEGTPRAASVAGPIECDPRVVPGNGSLAMQLRDLCPGIFSADLENFGYLELTSSGDAHANIFATSVVDTVRASSFAVPGQPAGAHDSGRVGVTSNLQVAGLRTRAVQDERLTCWIASLDEAKDVKALLRDDTGGVIGSLSYQLAARRMIAFDVAAELGLPPMNRDALSVAFESGDPALLVAGCGPARIQTDVLTYQAAQAENPADRARLRTVEVFARVTPGPYRLGYGWTHTTVGDADSNKVVLSTYLRSDDLVRCVLIPFVDSAGVVFNTIPWTEIQILDPAGAVVSGGSGAWNPPAFTTPPRGRFGPGGSHRYLIQISYDEAASGWPWGAGKGVWGVRCESASGMSEPIPLFTRFADDF